MTIRIEKESVKGRTLFRVSGRIALENLEELKAEMRGLTSGASLDLKHVTLVDVEGVRFLNACEVDGIELRHCSAYIREWMARERESQE